MAQKTGKKEKENAADKKDKKNNGGASIILLSSIPVILIAVASFFAYVHVSTVPDLPPVDLEVWWGPNTTDKQDTSVRPFRILFTDSMQQFIRKKFELYRSNTHRKKSINESWTYGINSEAFGQVFAHWVFQYNFEARAKFLNQYDQFKTNVQGLDIHFMHVKPKVDKNVKVLPLLLLHGWPGSIREFYEAMPLLTTVRPGYDFVFEVIAPSLPGFVYSQAPSKPGLNPFQISIIMRNLMQRLGFTQYYVQGGDIGHTIGSHMATVFPNEVLGFHTNLPTNFSVMSLLAWIVGAVCPTLAGKGLEDRMYPLKDKLEFFLEEFGYMHLQGTKPDTLGIVLADSPAGLAAYILDKFMIFTDPDNKFTEDGGIDKYYNKTNLLDNVMLYLTTNSVTTSLRLYKESVRSSELEQALARIPTLVPTWGLRLKHELVHQPDYILKWKYPNLVGTTNLNYGGHFAAFEKPKVFADDVFMAVKSFLISKKDGTGGFE